MAIQLRGGEYKDFDPEKLRPRELAVVLSGDPNASTGRSVYICFAPGVVKRLTTYEDFENEIKNATSDIQAEFTEDIRLAIGNAITATEAANAAQKAAEQAAEAANTAAEAAGAYVLGDISDKTVTFNQALTRENINSNENTATLFGKIQKWLSDLKTVAFTGKYSDLESKPTLGSAAACEVANNCTTTEEGHVLDARQGKEIQDEIVELNTKIEYKVLNTEQLLATSTEYTYKSIPGLSDYSLVLAVCIIGDDIRNILFAPSTSEVSYYVYATSSWNARASFICDFANNRIGVKLINATGWGVTNMKMWTVIGLLKR